MLATKPSMGSIVAGAIVMCVCIISVVAIVITGHDPTQTIALIGSVIVPGLSMLFVIYKTDKVDQKTDTLVQNQPPLPPTTSESEESK